MSKASTALLEQGTQTPSPAPGLIPAKTKTPRTYIGIGTVNGGTSNIVIFVICGDFVFLSFTSVNIRTR